MVAFLVGCGSTPALSARMSDADVRVVLNRDIPMGSSEETVHASLDRLGGHKDYRQLYVDPHSENRVLLQRLYDGRGPWVSTYDEDLKFLDISFVFAPEAKSQNAPERGLTKILLFRDKVRFVQGQAIFSPSSPKRKFKGQHGNGPRSWLGGLPPPADPLEGAE
jgi:hypothetical protein